MWCVCLRFFETRFFAVFSVFSGLRKDVQFTRQSGSSPSQLGSNACGCKSQKTSRRLSEWHFSVALQWYNYLLPDSSCTLLPYCGCSRTSALCFCLCQTWTPCAQNDGTSPLCLLPLPTWKSRGPDIAKARSSSAPVANTIRPSASSKARTWMTLAAGVSQAHFTTHLFCFGDDSHQRDDSHHCEDRRDAETAH